MKISSHVCAVAFLVLTVAALSPDAPAVAQFPQPVMQPAPMPFLGPGRILAGVRYRSIQAFRIRTTNPVIISDIGLGFPAFGPPQSASRDFTTDPYPIIPPTPTGVGTQDPRLSGVWLYDDGFVEPTGQVIGSAATPTPYTSVNADNGLGYIGPVPGQNVGSFFLNDLSVQQPLPAGLTYDTVGGATLSKLLTGLTPTSRDTLAALVSGTAATGPATGTQYFAEIPGRQIDILLTPIPEKDFNESAWAPYVEFSYPVTPAADFTLGLSVFRLSHNFNSLVGSTVNYAQKGFVDTYAFNSTDVGAIPAGASFFSGAPPDPAATYVIFPNGSVGQARVLPTRDYFTLDPVALPANQAISSSFDVTALEFRAGGRSAVPMGPSGQIGFSCGALLTPIPHVINTTLSYAATAAVPLFNIEVGDILYSTSHKQQYTWFGWGIYGGLDAEFGFPSFFLRSGIEYDLYFESKKYGDPIEHEVDLSGLSATIAAGARF